MFSSQSSLIPVPPSRFLPGLIRNSWGAYWGELGFFKLLRGNNTFSIEGGDCWYAEVENSIELAVESGALVGSMYGLVKNTQPSKSQLSLLEGGQSREVKQSQLGEELLLPLRESGETILTFRTEGLSQAVEGQELWEMGNRASGGVARRIGEQA